MTFTVTLSAPSGKAVRVNYATATQTANTSDYVTFTVSLSAASTTTVTVTVRTVAGTAISTGTLADFRAITSQTVTFTAGQTTKTVPVVIVGDRRVEPNETFRLTVNTVSAGATGVGAFGTGTITNDD